MNVEREHGPGTPAGPLGDITHGDPVLTFRIAWSHLIERPDYYRLLKQLERAPRSNPIAWMLGW